MWHSLVEVILVVWTAQNTDFLSVLVAIDPDGNCYDLFADCQCPFIKENGDR